MPVRCSRAYGLQLCAHCSAHVCCALVPCVRAPLLSARSSHDPRPASHCQCHCNGPGIMHCNALEARTMRSSAQPLLCPLTHRTLGQRRRDETETKRRAEQREYSSGTGYGYTNKRMCTRTRTQCSATRRINQLFSPLSVGSTKPPREHWHWHSRARSRPLSLSGVARRGAARNPPAHLELFSAPLSSLLSRHSPFAATRRDAPLRSVPHSIHELVNPLAHALPVPLPVPMRPCVCVCVLCRARRRREAARARRLSA